MLASAPERGTVSSVHHRIVSSRLPALACALAGLLALTACSSSDASTPAPDRTDTAATEAATTDAETNTDAATTGAGTGAATTPTPTATAERFDTGTFTGTDLWVDPAAGDDANDGSSRDAALRTVDAAWQRIPSGEELTTGYRILLAPGTYPVDGSVNYWEDRHGTAEAPIVLEAADGPHTAVFQADLNVFDVSWFFVLGVDVIREGDAFHCEQCDHIVLRDVELDGGAGAHETVKVNQSQHIYIEGADIHGADDNAIDFVAVQHGHVIDSEIHDAADWCMYTKGGSADIVIAGNDVHDCGTGGISAGQGTGFEFMTTPWLQYEAYGIQIVDNVIHGVEGAGLGVNGGYAVLLAHNTLYATGARSHVVEFVLGRRGCDGDAERCTANHDAGGWGFAGGEEQYIPNRHVWFYDNLIVNPDGAPSQWQHFQIGGPVDPPAESGVPSPAVADDDVRIVGNVIWNGPADHPLGTGDGCTDDNPTCSAAQITAENTVNTVRPELIDPEAGDFRLTDASRAALPAAIDIPELVWDLPADWGIPAGATAPLPASDPTVVGAGL